MKPTYRIIATSNFDLESVSDVLIADNIDYRDNAVIMCDAMNAKRSNATSTYWHTVVDETYVLRKFDPNA